MDARGTRIEHAPNGGRLIGSGIQTWPCDELSDVVNTSSGNISDVISTTTFGLVTNAHGEIVGVAQSISISSVIADSFIASGLLSSVERSSELELPDL